MNDSAKTHSGLQAAVSRAADELRSQGLLSEEVAVLITGLMVHRLQHSSPSSAAASEHVWADTPDRDPLKALDQILDEIEQTSQARISRPQVSRETARHVLQIISEAYRAFAGIDKGDVERLSMLGDTIQRVATPPLVAALMAEILDPRPDSSVHDMAMGSGDLLLASLHYARIMRGGARLHLSGTEGAPRLVTLAKMNLSLFGCNNDALTAGDPFVEGRHPKEAARYDSVISNPPVMRKLPAKALTSLQTHPAFKFGPPLTSVDFNYIQLAISLLKPGGRALLLVRMKPLFARGKGQDIRARLIESGYVESVVALPDRLLSTTSAACAVLMLRQLTNRIGEHRVKLINAAEEFGVDQDGKRTLTPENIKKIVAAIRNEGEIDRFSTLKTPADLAADDYCLLPANYLRGGHARINLGENTVMKRLHTVADVLSGTSLGKRSEGDTPVLQGRDLSGHKLHLQKLERKDLKSPTKSEVRAVTGDIVIQRISNSPASRYIDASLDGTIVANTVYIARLHKRDEMTARFLVQFLNSTAGRNRLSPNGMIPTLTKSALSAVEVPFVSESVMKLALGIDDLENSLHEHLDEASKLKEQLFSVTHPDQFSATFKELRQRHQSLKILELDAESLVSLNAAVGLAALEEAVAMWDRHKQSNDEGFWHTVLDERPFLFAQLFHFPIVIIGEKAYVGGKKLDNLRGSIADFLAKTKTTGAALIIEIKTPCTPLLAAPYRRDVYPWSPHLSGALSQVLHYRSTLTRDILQLREDVDEQLESDLPRCVVIAGNLSKELDTRAKRRSFERIRDNLHGVSVIGFDELFGRAAGVLEVLKNPG